MRWRDTAAAVTASLWYLGRSELQLPHLSLLTLGGRSMTKRSIWAVVAGVLVIVVGSTLVDIVLHVLDVFPPLGQPINDSQALLATSYRIVISIAGAWLTARLAPDRPMRHALILGVVGTVLGLVGVAATWDKGLGPRWYPVALAVLAIPQCWVGGKLYELRSGRP